MKSLVSKFSYLLFFGTLFNVFLLRADNYPIEKISGHNSEFLIESNNQKSDLKQSIFYAEGDVIITNTNNEFIAKSKKAIFYKLEGKIKLMGNVEVVTGDMNKINAGEVIYYLKENKFEAVGDQNQKVNTKFFFNENKIISQTK